MKWLSVCLLLLNVAWARNSLVVPAFLEASRIYVHQQGELSQENFFWKPELQRILQIMKHKNLDPEFLRRYLQVWGPWPIEQDRLDLLLTSGKTVNPEVPELAFQAFKLTVIEESDDFFNDDIYAYFFVTDGVVPTGKVTSLYKGLDEGESFFFNEVDRRIFPLQGEARRPGSHLIIDYGIVESDGDDIRELHKLSDVIVDIAVAVYAIEFPEGGAALTSLRGEVKSLSRLLLSLDHDDRLVTGTVAFQAEELSKLLRQQTFVEFSRKHGDSSPIDSWEYELYFRLLRK